MVNASPLDPAISDHSYAGVHCPRLAADGSIIASHHTSSILVTAVRDFLETPIPTDSDGLGLSQPKAVTHLPSGKAVGVHLVEELESPLKISEGASSLNLVVRFQMFKATSYDMSRVVMSDGSILSVYETRTGRQELRLPLPPVNAAYKVQPHHDWMRFSWDSNTVYLKRLDGRFYVTQLPPASESRHHESPALLAFSEIRDTPSPHGHYLRPLVCHIFCRATLLRKIPFAFC